MFRRWVNEYLHAEWKDPQCFPRILRYLDTQCWALGGCDLAYHPKFEVFHWLCILSQEKRAPDFDIWGSHGQVLIPIILMWNPTGVYKVTKLTLHFSVFFAPFLEITQFTQASPGKFNKVSNMNKQTDTNRWKQNTEEIEKFRKNMGSK